MSSTATARTGSPSDPTRLRETFAAASDRSARAMGAGELFQPTDHTETAEERKERKDRLAAERLRANAAVNVFTPVLLNACYKHVNRQELTELEQDFVDLANAAELGEDGIRAYGDTYAELDQRARAELFPEGVSGLAAGDGFTYDQAARAVLSLADTVKQLPNVQVVTGTMESFSDTDPVPAAAIQRYGWSGMVFDPASGTRAAEDTQVDYDKGPATLYSMESIELHCEHQAHAAVGEIEGTDEIYFVLNVADTSGLLRHTITHDYEGFKKGVTKSIDFPIFGGRFTDGIALSMQAWEHDYGKNKLRTEIAKHLEKISKKLMESANKFKPDEKPSAIKGLVGVVLGIAAIILKALDDDFIANVGDILDTSELDKRAKNGQVRSYIFVQVNSEGNEMHRFGKYHLRVRTARTEFCPAIALGKSGNAFHILYMDGSQGITTPVTVHQGAEGCRVDHLALNSKGGVAATSYSPNEPGWHFAGVFRPDAKSSFETIDTVEVEGDHVYAAHEVYMNDLYVEALYGVQLGPGDPLYVRARYFNESQWKDGPHNHPKGFAFNGKRQVRAYHADVYAYEGTNQVKVATGTSSRSTAVTDLRVAYLDSNSNSSTYKRVYTKILPSVPVPDGWDNWDRFYDPTPNVASVHLALDRLGLLYESGNAWLREGLDWHLLGSNIRQMAMHGDRVAVCGRDGRVRVLTGPWPRSRWKQLNVSGVHYVALPTP